jgi:acyl-CoA thioester hydrolase
MHEYIKRIYYHDTDCGGVVYYANYLVYMEEARTECLRVKGVELLDWAKQGFQFVVKHVDIDYKFPARYADTLKVVSKITKVGGASLNFSQEILVGSKLMVSADTVLVCVGKDMRPAVIPGAIREALEK